MSLQTVLAAATDEARKCGAEISGYSHEGAGVSVVATKGGREVAMSFRESQSDQSVRWCAEACLLRVGFLRQYTLTEAQLREVFEAGWALGWEGEARHDDKYKEKWREITK